MKRMIESEVKRLTLEILLVFIFTMVSIPLWDYISNETYADVADHYSSMNESKVVVTNRKKYIFAESFMEAIDERNMAFITSYEESGNNHDIFLLLEVGTNYDDIMFSNGINKSYLKDLYYDTSDYIYFKVDSKYINSNETVTYDYYIWTKNLKKDSNVKIKFAII